jgi:hypothetical protein
MPRESVAHGPQILAGSMTVVKTRKIFS